MGPELTTKRYDHGVCVYSAGELVVYMRMVQDWPGHDDWDDLERSALREARMR